MRRLVIAGNWKMYKNNKEAVETLTQLKDLTKDVKNVDIVIGAPFTCLSDAVKTVEGSNIQDNIILDIDMDRPNIMEVETKSYTDLVLDSLTISKEYIETYFEVKADFQQLIEDNEKISPIEIEETDSFLNWFSDLLFFLVENYAFAFRNLRETMETFREELVILAELKEKKDYVAYVSTLDYCISDILENFKNNIDYYYKSILEDLEQKKVIF